MRTLFPLAVVGLVMLALPGVGVFAANLLWQKPHRPTGDAMPNFQVLRDGVLLGTLTCTGTDQPWWLGEFDPAPGFESVRTLFDRERTLLDKDDMDAWGRVSDELAVGMVLAPQDGRKPITKFLLHIAADGRQAWWRY